MAIGTAHRRRHEWSLVGANSGGAALLMAVCRACGVIRTEAAQPRRETHVDLSGVCSGESEPQIEWLGQFG